MANSRILRALLFLFASPLGALFADSLTPQAGTVTPRVGRPGVTLTISGAGLDRSALDEVYLTDHRFDLKMKILEQSATTLKIRIPPFAKPGRFQLLFLTTGKPPVLLEQPFSIQIEEPEPFKEADRPALKVEMAANVSASHVLTPVPLSPKVDALARAPQAIRKPMPTYPVNAALARVQGSVTLEVNLQADGKVKAVRVLKGHPLLHPSAAAALKNWVFEPAGDSSGPVASKLNVTLNYKLDLASFGKKDRRPSGLVIE